jgi:hypothetical protein
MDSTRRTLVATLVAISCAAPLWAAQAPAPAGAPVLTKEEMTTFLLNARIGSKRPAGSGVTNSKRATLTDGTVTHDAHIQTVDVAMPIFQAGKASETNFKDTYRFNIAGYRLADLLGIRVPVSVERRVDGAWASVTWWVDNVGMDEEDRIKKGVAGPEPLRTTQQLTTMRVFDELIQNKDRNQGNILWTKDWTLWLIDHTRAFRLGRELLRPDRLVRVDRELLARLRALTTETVSAAVGESLRKDELAAVMARRDLLVKHFDDRITRAGEANVLFTMAPAGATARADQDKSQ